MSLALNFSFFPNDNNRLQTATTTSRLSPGRVRRNGSDILNPSNLKSSTGKRTEGRLGSGSRRARLASSGSTDLDVNGSDTELLAFNGSILGGKHGGIRGTLITIGLDLHSSGDTNDGFTSRKISHVHKGIVETGEDVGDAKDLLTLTGVGHVVVWCISVVIVFIVMDDNDKQWNERMSNTE